MATAVGMDEFMDTAAEFGVGGVGVSAFFHGGVFGFWCWDGGDLVRAG
jgi:LDH2 family malate/lactate/ureidoglycolate dehydrogenase